MELRFIEAWVPSPQHGEGIGIRGEVLQYRVQMLEININGSSYEWSEWQDVPHVKEK